MTRAGAAALLTLSALVLRPAPLLSGELTLHGFALGRGIAVEGPRSWLEGGWGRLIDGPAEGTGSAQIAPIKASCVFCPLESAVVFLLASKRNCPSNSRSVSRFHRARNDAR